MLRNRTDFPLTIQLWQVGVLYHDYVRPGETFYRVVEGEKPAPATDESGG